MVQLRIGIHIRFHCCAVVYFATYLILFWKISELLFVSQSFYSYSLYVNHVCWDGLALLPFEWTNSLFGVIVEWLLNLMMYGLKWMEHLPFAVSYGVDWH